MSILVYADSANNKLHKSAFEAVSYASQMADGDQVVALVAGEAEGLESLGKYGADKVLHCKDAALADFQPTLIAAALKAAAEKEGAKTIIFPHDLSGKSVAPILAAKMDAGLVSGAVALPDTTDGFVVKKAVFSGKAFAHTKINSEYRIISVMPNSIEKKENEKSATIEEFSADLGSSRLQVKEQKMEEADLPLTEAEKVVSAGRGLKGPENWGMIEDLAKALGAATACSRPVADMDWRPHHEHVGQTGVAIRPNLYIAIGISGAIQHLAGVNQSKVIVVINNDPEAPFFKSADYGIVGDAFDVVPKLVEAAKSMNLDSNA
ncbi:MAG: electron transfer flavoprotein subunit alpha [Flavobacteriales bacterium]|nr:electron transfer flavoprotein subunit alpha [Flavobacteriales bacterium]|tara:strand:+ start:34929 stop:35891 length:963 start_codon:yes stop_codon:yes gene_type:complete